MDNVITGMNATVDFNSSLSPSSSTTKTSSSKPTTAAGAAAEKSKTVMTDEGHSMASVDSSTDPDAEVSSTIRAHSAEQKDAFNKAIRFKNEAATLTGQAEKEWRAEPRYNFTQRATLYKAYVKAQATFQTQSALVHLEQAKATYLEALSRSSIPLDQQHAMYSEFKEAIQAARIDRTFANHTEAYASLVPGKGASTSAAEESKKATQSEQLVKDLLKDIQKPHAESRHAIAQVLRYRDVQLHQAASKSSPEAEQLKSEMTAIKSFQAAGGLDSLTKPEAEQLNRLFGDAQEKHTAWQQELTALKSSPSTSPSAESLREAEKDFKAADAVVMAQIKVLGSRLKGPPQVRKDLVDTLKHKEALRGNSNDRVQLDDDIETLKTFLDSRELAALDSKAAAPLTTLFRDADKQYANWQRLETAAKALEAAAKTATNEPSEPQPKDAPKDAPKIPTKKEVAQKKAERARENAIQAAQAFKEADIEVMHEIRDLGKIETKLPKTIYATEDGKISRTLPPSPPLKEEPQDKLGVPNYPPPPIPTSSSAASAVGVSVASSAPPAKEDLASLRTFAERKLNAATEGIRSLTTGKTSPKETEFKQQSASLTKLLGVLDDPKTPAEKINPLVVRMKEIEGNKEKLAAARTASSPTETIIQARENLENDFLAKLQELFPPT